MNRKLKAFLTSMIAITILVSSTSVSLASISFNSSFNIHSDINSSISALKSRFYNFIKSYKQFFYINLDEENILNEKLDDNKEAKTKDKTIVNIDTDANTNTKITLKINERLKNRGYDITYADYVNFLVDITKAYYYEEKTVEDAIMNNLKEIKSPSDLAKISCISYIIDGTKPIVISKVKCNNFNELKGKDIYLVSLGGTNINSETATGIIADVESAYEVDHDYENEIVDTINKVIPKKANIIITGMSLGGMVAQQVAADDKVKNNYNVVRVLSVGSGPLAIDQINAEVVRFVNINDTVQNLTYADKLGTYDDCKNQKVITVETEYKTVIGVHTLGYIMDDDWKEYDVFGNKGGKISFTVEEVIGAYGAPKTEQLGTSFEKILKAAFQSEYYVKELKDLVASLKFEALQELFQRKNLENFSNVCKIASKKGFSNINQLTNDEKEMARVYIDDLAKKNVTLEDLIVLENILSSEELSNIDLSAILASENILSLADLFNKIDMNDVRKVIKSADEKSLVSLVSSVTKNNLLSKTLNSISLTSSTIIDINSLTTLLRSIDYRSLFSLISKIDMNACIRIGKVFTTNMDLVENVLDVNGLADLFGSSEVNNTILTWKNNSKKISNSIVKGNISLFGF